MQSRSVLQVELWLNKVLNTMRETIRHELSEAVVSYEEKPRDQWLFDFPAQVCFVSSFTLRCNWFLALLLSLPFLRVRTVALTSSLPADYHPDLHWLDEFNRVFVFSLLKSVFRLRYVALKSGGPLKLTLRLVVWKKDTKMHWKSTTVNRCVHPVNVCVSEEL